MITKRRKGWHGPPGVTLSSSRTWRLLACKTTQRSYLYKTESSPPFPPAVAQQAALKRSCRSDSGTRELPVALRVRAAHTERRKKGSRFDGTRGIAEGVLRARAARARTWSRSVGAGPGLCLGRGGGPAAWRGGSPCPWPWGRRHRICAAGSVRKGREGPCPCGC